MKTAYPVVLILKEDGILVNIPGFDISTFGKNTPEAISMARDAIGIAGVDMQDNNECLPEPMKYEDVQAIDGSGNVTLVDVDFAQYRRDLDNRMIRKNCTIPFWLSEEAEEAGINFSEVLREALQARLQNQAA